MIIVGFVSASGMRCLMSASPVGLTAEPRSIERSPGRRPRRRRRQIGGQGRLTEHMNWEPAAMIAPV